MVKNGLKIVIENMKGSYKSFGIDNDPEWKDYPLKGVTYPVDYGYIVGYKSEDGNDLDVFVGSGDIYGYIKVWRVDVAIETKFIMGVSTEEYVQIITEFEPVIIEKVMINGLSEFEKKLEKFKK